MNTINIAADATAQRIGIGNQYENLATAVVFDCSKFAEDHGAGTAQVIHKRPTESIGYICTNVTQDGNTVTWLITDDDTSFTGKGQVQLRWYVDDVLRKSVIFPTYILPSVTSSGDAPEDVKSAVEKLMEYIQDNTISTEDLDERIANYFYDHPLPMEGEADGLVAGSAKQLLSESYTLDQVPYLYRKSPDSDRAVESIVGGTVGWNQLCNSSSVTVQSGHKYLSKIGGTYYVGSSTGTAITDLTSGTDMVFDLTLLFGSTIADYIYSLEQSTEGAGVAKLKEWGFFTEDYYEYCEPTLRSVEGLVSKKTVGFNQWDEISESGYYDIPTGGKASGGTWKRNTNPIHVVPNTEYYFKATVPSSGSFGAILFYDGDNNLISYITNSANVINTIFTTPNNCHYMTFYMHPNWFSDDICINLSDPIKNGQYEPYESYSYPLDSEVVLRGVPKLDSNNSLYFDGDVYSADGSVSRRFTERAYQSGDESLADAITDGTTTVVKLATPTTEIALPYHNPQIVGDTEEFVTTGLVPVGHSTKYYQNLRKKIEGLPWNFSDLIAPTEVTNKATRNYTTGSYLILNNILYKVTANIANGGTITPNTNVTATTIMAEIMTL